MTSKHLRALIGEGDDLPARATYAERERAGVHAQKTRLAARARIGRDWDGKADNDNINWPLATSLIREGNTELLKAAMAYRKIHAEAYSGALLGGTGVSIGDGFALDRHTKIRADGTITYKHVRQRTAAEVDIPARQYVPPFEDEDAQTNHNSIRVPKAWNGDAPVNNMLDSQTRLVALRQYLGVLVEPLEMSVVDGATYEAVGASLGARDRTGATSAGRATVHLGLISVTNALGFVRRVHLSVA